MEISKETIEAMAEAIGSEQLIECLYTAFDEENLKSVEALALLFREKMTSDKPWEIEAWSPEIESDQWEPES
jgi:hypothetical protein